MSTNHYSSALTAAAAEFTVEPADTKAALRDAYRLRYQVYCVERGFEHRDGDMETDPFDDHAPHIVLRRRSDREVVGTARLVLPQAGRPDLGLPIRQLCPASLVRGIPERTAGEVSRFALSKERRDMSLEATALLRLGLVQGLVRLSRDHGITHWLAVMERSLLRLLRSTAIHFDPVGPAVEYHGLRQPAVASIDGVLARMRREHPAIWSYVTGDGCWWPEPTRPEFSLAA